MMNPNKKPINCVINPWGVGAGFFVSLVSDTTSTTTPEPLSAQPDAHPPPTIISIRQLTYGFPHLAYIAQLHLVRLSKS